MPTIRQAKTFEKVLENDGNISVSKAMVLAGYSAANAHNPHRLTRSKGWQALLDEVDDESILQRVRKIMGSGDARASLTAADMLLKLKDKYPASKMKFQASYEERNKVV